MNAVQKPKKGFLRSVLSVSIGNALEWYEYMLYAHFANIIGALFFPTESKTASMMFTFATFAVGLAARPFGGLLFGYLGDKYSRKKTLTATILLMSVPTFIIGLLPTYATIGIFAPILLVTLRLFQGVALGGEFGSSCVYLYESVKKERRGFFGTLALTSVGTGLILSACTILVIESIFSKEELSSFGWRIPFFISVVGSIMGFYFRKNLLETEDFLSIKSLSQTCSNPIGEVAKHHKKNTLLLFMIFLTTQISFFVVFIFGKTMMISFLGYSFEKAALYNLLTVVSYTISTLIFGYLSDKTNKKYIILIGILGILASIYPFIHSLRLNHATAIVALSLTLGALIGMSEGTLNPLVAETFPTKVRATGVAFCWNFTSIIFGGSAPMVSMYVIEKFNTVNAVAYYMMSACSISLISILYLIAREKLERKSHP